MRRGECKGSRHSGRWLTEEGLSEWHSPLLPQLSGQTQTGPGEIIKLSV